MSTRSAFTDGVVQVDHWTKNTPPGSPGDGDTALIGNAPTGVWAGHAGELAFYSTLTAAWRYIQPSGSPGLRGCLFFVKDSSQPMEIVHHYFGHDGTTTIGPFPTAEDAAAALSTNASLMIAAEEFAD
jgi:hypothetical protein